MMETMEQETMVTVRSVLVKETSIWGGEGHIEMDWDVNPDTGRRESTRLWVCDDNVDELFREQQRTPEEIINCCQMIVQQLRKEGKTFYAGIDLFDLYVDCNDWVETEFGVK